MSSATGTMYVLDFDGVICDSRDECMVTSYNAYRRLVDPRFHNVYREDIIPPEHRAKFLEFRFLVRRAREFKLLWDLIVSGAEITATRLPGLAADDVNARLDAFQDLFYRVRSEWMAEDLESWLAHNPVYAGVPAKLKLWIDAERMVVVSAKDRRGILTVLEHCGFIMPTELLFSMDSGDKPSQFRRVAARWRGRDVVVIDDNLENLLYARQAGFRAYLASWGYTSKEIIERSRSQGIAALSLEGFLLLE